MKLILVVLLACLLCASGCGLFPSVKKAQEVAEKREVEVAEAVEAYKRAGAELQDVVAKYKAAVTSGDTSTAAALLAAVQQATSKYELAGEVAKSSEKLYLSAVEDFKAAKSSSDYVGTIFGWLFTLGSGLVTGALGLRKGSKATEALTGVTGLVEKLRPADNTDPKWLAATSAMNTSLSTPAKKLIEAVRP